MNGFPSYICHVVSVGDAVCGESRWVSGLWHWFVSVVFTLCRVVVCLCSVGVAELCWCVWVCGVGLKLVL